MVLISLILFVAAFTEVVVFLYLRRLRSKLLAMKVATHLNFSSSEKLFKEAEDKNQDATTLFNEAKWLVLQAKAGPFRGSTLSH
jgi:hypothetical protein